MTQKKQVSSVAFVIISALIANVFFYSCKKEEEKKPEDVVKTAIATINPTYTDTAVSGTASFKQINNGDVTLTLDITVPYKANKSVAVHMHAMGDCANHGGNAMGHWNPTNVNHGKWGSAAFHLGDIGNINLDANGKATYTLTTNLWNINGSDATRNVVGKSIIIHSGVDDYTTQPTGNAGPRIGCGAIQ